MVVKLNGEKRVKKEGGKRKGGRKETRGNEEKRE